MSKRITCWYCGSRRSPSNMLIIKNPRSYNLNIYLCQSSSYTGGRPTEIYCEGRSFFYSLGSVNPFERTNSWL